MLGAHAAGYPATQLAKLLMGRGGLHASAIRHATVVSIELGGLDPACLVQWDEFVRDLLDAADRARMSARPVMSGPVADVAADSTGEITTVVASELLGVRDRHVRRLVQSKRIRGRKQPNGRWLVDAAACRDYASMRSV